MTYGRIGILPFRLIVEREENSGTLSCPQCHGALVYPDGLNGEIVCRACGLVINRARVSQGFKEWTPKWFYNWSEKDSETLREWLSVLRTVSCRLNLADFPYREETARMIRSKSNMLFRSQRFGKNKTEAVAALVHLILKKYDEVRPLKEICDSLSLDKRLVMKYAWTMRKMIGFRPTVSAREYLWKYAWNVTPDTELIKTADQLLTRLKMKMSGNPLTLAAGALYYVCRSRKLKVSKDEIGEAFHISNRTVYSNERRISRLISAQDKLQLETQYLQLKLVKPRFRRAVK